jgi:hypothetical protein
MYTYFHKTGKKFGRDTVKPLCNLIHPRLLIAVDWHIDKLKSLNRSKINNYLLNDLTLKDHNSYTKFMQTLNTSKIHENDSNKSKNSKSSNSSNSLNRLVESPTQGLPLAPTHPIPRPMVTVSGKKSVTYMYVYL